MPLNFIICAALCATIFYDIYEQRCGCRFRFPLIFSKRFRFQPDFTAFNFRVHIFRNFCNCIDQIFLYSLYYAKACNVFVGPICASLRPGNTASVEERWQHSVGFDRPEICISDFQFQGRTRYRSTSLVSSLIVFIQVILCVSETSMLRMKQKVLKVQRDADPDDLKPIIFETN